MADALCGPSNALQSFQKQTSVDRTLQQDRITARQAPAESFRSAPGPNVGILDAEFEAFQAGHPLQAGYPEPHLFYHGSSASSFQQNNGQPQLPNWASDFQNLHLNEAGASPIPQSQFHQHAPLQRTGGWHQDVLRQQNQHSPYLSQQQERAAGQNYSGWSYGYTGGLMPQHNNTLSPMAQQKQPERQAEDVYDEVAFERAFDVAREEMQQSEETAHRKDTQVNAGLHDTNDQESQGWLDHSRIGSDRILDEARNREEEGKEPDDAEELARTAGQLLENVKGDQSQKFQESNFLSLMRQLRDKEVRVEGDKLVDVSIPSSTPSTEQIQVSTLHPGGSGYPIYHARPEWLVAAGEVRRESDPPRAEETALLYYHLARNYGDLLRANDIQPDELLRRARISLADAGLSPDYLSERTFESSEATDTPAEYTSVEAIVKRLAEEQRQKLQDYQLMLLEQQNKKRLLMARQE